MVETSIIIPTLNEEKYLPKLLKSIKQQNYKNYEIIVADNKSKDKTKQIARKYKCKVVNGGLPSKARNNGAKVAKGKYFLFIDADVVLPKNCLSKSIKQFERQDLDIGVAKFLPLEGDWRDRFLHEFYHFMIRTAQYLEPYINTGYLLCKRKLFKKLSGFDETVFLGEDCDFGKRANLIGAKIAFLRKVFVNLSIRRFLAEGRIYLFFKYFSIPWYRLFFGEIRKGNKIYSYNWGYKNKI